MQYLLMGLLLLEVAVLKSDLYGLQRADQFSRRGRQTRRFWLSLQEKIKCIYRLHSYQIKGCQGYPLSMINCQRKSVFFCGGGGFGIPGLRRHLKAAEIDLV